jgi:excisionase family DNA binding protein
MRMLMVALDDDPGRRPWVLELDAVLAVLLADAISAHRLRTGGSVAWPARLDSVEQIARVRGDGRRREATGDATFALPATDRAHDRPVSLLLDLHDTAAALGVSERTVQRMTVAGHLEAVRIGRAVRYRRADVEALAGVGQ